VPPEAPAFLPTAPLPHQPGTPLDSSALIGARTDAGLLAAVRPAPGAAANTPVFVLFGSAWCAHCHEMLAVLDTVRQEGARGRFVAALVDGMGAAADAVRFTPTLAVYRRGRRVDSFYGGDETKLRDRVWLHSD
jgi:thioredoxin-like negative regulator of GroEL